MVGLLLRIVLRMISSDALVHHSCEPVRTVAQPYIFSHLLKISQNSGCTGSTTTYLPVDDAGDECGFLARAQYGALERFYYLQIL